MSSAILDSLPPGEARRLEPDELPDLLAFALLLREEDSAMTGPIRVLGLSGADSRWIQEFDTRRRPILRHLQPWQDPDDFIQSRRESYERMWDG
jgi:hypothetical protein